MNKATPPRILAAVSAAVVTVFLFDAVARMGQYPESHTAAYAGAQSVAYHVADASR